ncbi:sodium:proton antiporter [Lacticaseibacillus paracasei]|uniref:cation:proton antiporter n=1 Tax=Lacticaseibacillus paracasei TaxID=1597 RepID=UPI002F268B4B
MHLVEAVLFLMALVIVSNVLSHYIVAVPVSLIQVALGLGAALFFHLEINLATDWFMLLFIAPLLFYDGRNFPRRELWELRGPIIGNAIFLVFVTMLVGGYLIHFLIPPMPLPASFALAAILSPTDPIAVQSLAKRVHLPKGVLHLVSGESLINDASGLIGFKYGIAATMTGTFVLGNAVRDFFYVAIVGALAGLVLISLINLSRKWLLQQGINDVILHTILQVLTPFFIYLVVDEFMHASGVIAVVVAGLLSNTRYNRYIAALPELRIVSERTWDIIVYTLNGIIFLILGIELPVAMTDTIADHEVSTFQALGFVVVVYLGILIVRTLWIYGYMLLVKRSKEGKASWRAALLSGISGVRGAITLVGVLAVPAALSNGDAFPERSLMLFIAAGVVVLSLIVAIIALPLVTRSVAPLQTRGSTIVTDDSGDQDDDDSNDIRIISMSQAQTFVFQMAVRRVESERRETNQKAALDLIAEYQYLIRRLELAEDTGAAIPPLIQDELDLRKVGVQGELYALDDLWRDNKIMSKSYAKARKQLQHRLNDLDSMAKRSGRPTFRMLFERSALRLSHWWYTVASEQNRSHRFFNERLFIEKETAKGGLKYLSQFLRQKENKAHNYNRQVIYALIVQYRNRIASVKALNTHKSTQYEQELGRLRAIAFADERAAIHDLTEKGYITMTMAQKLNQNVNFTENAATLTSLEEV